MHFEIAVKKELNLLSVQIVYAEKQPGVICAFIIFE